MITDTALDKVPGPWETVIQGAVTGLVNCLSCMRKPRADKKSQTQAVPNIIAGVIPAIMAAANPMGAIAMTAGSGISGSLKMPNGMPTQATAPGASNMAVAEKGAATIQAASDPAFAAAKEIMALVTSFYEFLGGETGMIDWEKFEEPKAKSEKPSGLSYLSATLKGHKKKVHVTGTEANKKLMAAYDGLIKVRPVVWKVVRSH